MASVRNDFAHIVHYTKLTPVEGTSNITLTPGGGNTTSFELPATNQKGMMLSESCLSFNMLIENASSHSTSSGGHKNGWIVFMNTIPMFSRIELTTRSGVYLCNYERPDLAMRIGILPNTWHDDLLTKDIFSAKLSDSVSATVSFGVCSFIQANNSLATARDAYRINSSNGTNVPAPGSSLRNYTEPSYFLFSSSGKATNPYAKRLINVNFPMRQLLHSIFEMDKILMFNESIVLRLTWAPASRMGYICSLDSTTAVKTSTPLTTTISSLYYYHALENNVNVNNVAREELANGYTFICERPHVYQQTLTGALQVLTMRYNTSMGPKLKRIYATLIPNGTQNRALQYDLSNDQASAKKVSSYYQEFNGERVTPFNITCSTHEDYYLMKKYLKDSCIDSVDVFDYNWFVYYSLEDRQRKIPERSPQDSSEGFDLSGPGDYLYTISYTTNSQSNNHVVFSVTEQIVQITPSGVVVA